MTIKSDEMKSGFIVDLPGDLSADTLRLRQDIKTLESRIKTMKRHYRDVISGRASFGDFDAKRSLAASVGHWTKQFKAVIGDQEVANDEDLSRGALRSIFNRANKKYRAAKNKFEQKFGVRADAARSKFGWERDCTMRKIDWTRRTKLLSGAGRSLAIAANLLKDGNDLKNIPSMAWAIANEQIDQRQSELENKLERIQNGLSKIDDWQQRRVHNATRMEQAEFNAAAQNLNEKERHILYVERQIAFLEDMLDVNRKMHGQLADRDLRLMEVEARRNEALRLASQTPPPFARKPDLSDALAIPDPRAA